MSRESEIAMEHALAPSDMGKNIDRRLYPSHYEIAQLAYSLHESRGRQDGHQMGRLAARRTGTGAPLRVTAKPRVQHRTH